MREHPNRDEWDERQLLVMTIEEDEYTAYCSSGAQQHVYEGDEFRRKMPYRGPLGEPLYGGSPFPFDVVFEEGCVDDIDTTELGEQFAEKFNEHVENVLTKIDEA